MFAVTEDCVEPTKGWINREGKPLLTVCFMHSFGKCVGRTSSNPATCFQIHIKANVLNALRKHYTNPTRRFFTRTVKAMLSPELRRLLCMRAHKEFKVQYLEYRVSDIFPSTGLLQYEAAYRRWLFSDDTNAEHAGTITVLQCLQFSMTGSCDSSTDCPYIHADLKKAQARDPMLARALRDVSDANQGLPTVSIRVPELLPAGHSSTICPADATYATLTDGANLQSGMPSDPARDFTKVPAFTLVYGEGESGGRCVPLQMHQRESSSSSAGGHANSTYPLSHVPFINQDDPASEMTAAKSQPTSGKNEKASVSGKSGSGWVNNSNEGAGSINNHTGSCGSGTD
ncbi:hypothetical protein LMJF_32_0040 [Leishmania major strain Friedlin]|uniref:C3H1-type domain-containing protein n=1 Tax=Leishmania major TaxID=5664 RepID=Q4Q5T2_LEIMA|nr:hypothetical protein LMJF_32_0040 [Leishmania major strain Friedlin]CAG9579920.1 hypothetical_protein_-_conserved [Leishmania major strain Friedlin]CAJ08438.1 hypothetical protein LMJF_32_0040 [Leishmania major strain Friedlin]|eukprot:XP_001685316.1 hypothetical protein LMJF_32_0040 [Leishmania major strain Friedlin]